MKPEQQTASGGVGTRAHTFGLFDASRPPLCLQNVDACLVNVRVTARLVGRAPASELYVFSSVESVEFVIYRNLPYWDASGVARA